METQSNISIISKSKTIIQVSIISAVLAFSITMIGKINMHDFLMNILDWQSM